MVYQGYRIRRLAFMSTSLFTLLIHTAARLEEKSSSLPSSTQQITVFQQPGRFGGWPANNGIWSWGNEILVGFEMGYYKAGTGDAHAIDKNKPQSRVLARSLDGGVSWSIEDPDHFVGDSVKNAPLTSDIRFSDPGFVMRVDGEGFFISYDRGKTWQGKFELPTFGMKKLTARTDYLVNGPLDCFFFLSAKVEQVQAVGHQDRAFCARTIDGGKSFQFTSWMTGEPLTVRSVMPSTVRVSKKNLVSALRRRLDRSMEKKPDNQQNYIDICQSMDNGLTWEFLCTVGNTDDGNHNGNPPALIRLQDGRLCVAYGYRAQPFGIRAHLSSDNGKTWSDAIHVRDDGGTWDIGYPRMVQRPDGKIVTIYYFNTKENPEQQIAATIWDPNLLRRP